MITYKESIAYLDSFINWERKPGKIPARAWGLERVRELSELLGNPWEEFRILHVAGTKGKGSVCVYAEALLRAAGFNTGLFMSPHVVDLRERIQVNGELVREEVFAAAIERMKPRLERLRFETNKRPPSYFEILMHAAFLAFNAENVDFAVIETGLGGRLDATSIVRPDACSITPISRDHTGLLGETLGEIAREKAGIFKRGVPVVIGRQEAGAEKVLLEQAEIVGAPVINFTEALSSLPAGLEEPPLLGKHQRDNLATAWSLVATGVNVSESAAREKLKTVRLPGRCDLVRLSRCCRGVTFLVDGAHNDGSAKALRKVLDSLSDSGKYPGRKILVFACASNKRVSEILSPLADWPDEFIITTYDSPRCSTPEAVSGELANLGKNNARSVSPSTAAFEAAAESAGKTGLVCVCGSLYLAGEFYRWQKVIGEADNRVQT